MVRVGNEDGKNRVIKEVNAGRKRGKIMMGILGKNLWSRLAAIFLLGYGLFQFNSMAAAQQEELVNTIGDLYRNQKSILQELERAPAARDKKGQEKIKTYVCPKDKREFQLVISSGDLEVKNGMKSIYCPYDGFQFYPVDSEASSSSSMLSAAVTSDVQQEGLYTLRSPVDGKEFKAAVDVQRLKEDLNSNIKAQIEVTPNQILILSHKEMLEQVQMESSHKAKRLVDIRPKV